MSHPSKEGDCLARTCSGASVTLETLRKTVAQLS
jgi:hypothetical protein